MRAEKFEHEVIGTSRTFYRAQNLRVVIQGDRAMTDGNVVYLPAIDHTQDIDLHKQRVMRGYIDHEAGHGRHTDLKAWPKSGHDPATLTYAPVLANAIEDVRIEKLIIDEYPGAQKNLEAVSEAVNKGYLELFKSDPSIAKDFAKIGAVALTWEGRKRLGYEGKTNDQCLDTLPPDVRKKVSELCDLAEKCKSFGDAIQLAVTIDRDINTALRTGVPGSLPGGMGGGAGNGKGSGYNGPMPGGEGGDGGEGHDRDENAGADVDNTKGEKPKMLSPEIDQGVNKVVGPVSADGRKGYRVWTWDKDHVIHVSDTMKRKRHQQFKDAAHDTGLVRYDRARASVDGAVNQMRRKLERALISKANRGWLRNREEGTLDSKRLVAAYQGQLDVRKQREPVDELNVCLGLIVDQSGSMSGHKIQLAQQAAISYAEAVDKVNIPFMIGGFTTTYLAADALNPLESVSIRGYRNFALDLYLYKKFDEPLKKARPAIGAMTGCEMHANADGDSLLQFYWKFIKGRPEQRKIMVVFSDGLPAASGGDQRQRLRDVVAYLESEGVELLAIGICSDAPKEFYKKWTVVEDAEDLAKEALDQLAKLLIDPNFKVDNRALMKVEEVIKR